MTRAVSFTVRQLNGVRVIPLEVEKLWRMHVGQPKFTNQEIDANEDKEIASIGKRICEKDSISPAVPMGMGIHFH
jgi:hypothetical protein